MTKNPLGDDFYDIDPDDPFGGFGRAPGRKPTSPPPAMPAARSDQPGAPEAAPVAAPVLASTPEPIPEPTPAPPPPAPPPKPDPEPKPIHAAEPRAPKDGGTAKRARLAAMGEALARAPAAKLPDVAGLAEAPAAWRAQGAPKRKPAKTEPPKQPETASGSTMAPIKAAEVASVAENAARAARAAGWIDGGGEEAPVILARRRELFAPLAPEEIAAVASGLAIHLARATRGTRYRLLSPAEEEDRRESRARNRQLREAGTRVGARARK